MRDLVSLYGTGLRRTVLWKVYVVFLEFLGLVIEVLRRSSQVILAIQAEVVI